jgi:hypothetical protein
MNSQAHENRSIPLKQHLQPPGVNNFFNLPANLPMDSEIIPLGDNTSRAWNGVELRLTDAAKNFILQEYSKKANEFKSNHLIVEVKPSSRRYPKRRNFRAFLCTKKDLGS